MAVSRKLYVSPDDKRKGTGRRVAEFTQGTHTAETHVATGKQDSDGRAGK